MDQLKINGAKSINDKLQWAMIMFKLKSKFNIHFQ